MKPFVLLFISAISFNILFAQLPRLNRHSTIDTLAMSISFSDSINDPLQAKFLKSFNESIANFNQRNDREFYIIVDSSRKGEFVHIDVGEIKYSTTGRSIWVSFLDLGLLAADVALINIGWPPVLLPILTPAVRSNIHLDMSEGVIDDRNKIESLLPLPSGYFVGIEKQNERLDRKIGRNTERLLKKLNRQQKKNNAKKER